MAVALSDTVELTEGVTPEEVLDCLANSVNMAWERDGDNGTCSVPANFVGWLLQEFLALQDAAGKWGAIDEKISAGPPRHNRRD